ncbi:GPRS-like protein [Mya arenaria]|uniref:GPRS-like protein n=1 Tax=Mya arenaria TaxID=6604 RepID=A0ABY7DET5_MYAAR|nr:serine-enriched protein-like [Mya arenaria]XP_052794814.1 serine-enriched protein-like [Mya arenaria]XP_052794841.1 serine-enriched protein-like [Mya arenaria]WAQ94855.1 GPRS-like protein [Mya arenaria]WAQ94857.1 GPRS-like protein [Mya arenaria]
MDFECSQPLLSKCSDDQFINECFEYDDSSSGYSSSDISDVDSVTSYESSDSAVDDSSVNLFTARDPREEVMHFQSTHVLCETMKVILEMPDMCDVTFLVGERQVPVHAVRAILATRSRIFYDLILKYISLKDAEEKVNCKKIKNSKDKLKVGIARQCSDRLVIPVRKYDPETFRSLIQFVHCGSISITEETVAGLFCGAHQFRLPDLSQACLDFVERCILLRRTQQILNSTRCYNHHSASKKLFEKIYEVLDKRHESGHKQTSV